MVLYGSIEAGGTKFVLAVGNESSEITKKIKIPTTTPDETIGQCITFFKENPVDALGVGSFGPADINKTSPTYGQILATPKAGWAGADLVGALKAALNIPIAFTTDVNASAYGEYIAGAGKEAQSLVYFTIGTGIGGGAIQDGHFIGGTAHAEMGHAVCMPRPDDDYEGTCPFHGNHCYEGLAAGPSLQGRTGIPGQELSRDNKVFDLVSYYVAEMLFTTYVNTRPEKIVLGGSVVSDAELPVIRRYFDQFNNGYVTTPTLDDLIVMTAMPDNSSATVGDFELAKQALDESRVN